MVGSRVVGPRTARAAAAVASFVVEAGIRARAGVRWKSTASVAGSVTMIEAFASPRRTMDPI